MFFIFLLFFLSSGRDCRVEIFFRGIAGIAMICRESPKGVPKVATVGKSPRGSAPKGKSEQISEDSKSQQITARIHRDRD